MKMIWMIPALLAALSLFVGPALAEKQDEGLNQIQLAQSEEGERQMNQQREKKEKAKRENKKKKKDKRDKDKDKSRDKDKDQDRAKYKDRDDDTIYGNQLMTEQERIEHRERMRAAKTDAERDQIRREHHELMKERGRARGVTLPDEPPTERGGMGQRKGQGR